MVIENLKRVLLTKPFAPFRIVVSGGKALDVVRPFQVALGLTQFTYQFPDSNRRAVLKLDQIVSLESLGRATAS